MDYLMLAGLIVATSGLVGLFIRDTMKIDQLKQKLHEREDDLRLKSIELDCLKSTYERLERKEAEIKEKFLQLLARRDLLAYYIIYREDLQETKRLVWRAAMASGALSRVIIVGSKAEVTRSLYGEEEIPPFFE